MIKTELVAEVSSFTRQPTFHQTRLTIPPSRSTENHYHHLTYETYYVVSGEGEIDAVGITYQVKSGVETGSEFVDFVKVPPHSWHQIRNTGDVPLVILSTKNQSSEFEDYYIK